MGFLSSNDESKQNYLMVAEGNNGQVELYEDKIAITRKGILAKVSHGFKGSKEIPVESITSIQLKEPGKLTAGFIQFGQSGYSESDGGLMSATQDENSVNFNKGNLNEFQDLKKRIYELKDDNSNEYNSNSDTALEALKKKFVEDKIDEEEFQRKKELLGE